MDSSKKKAILLLFILFYVTGCDSQEQESAIQGEYIYRKSQDVRLQEIRHSLKQPPSYPWQRGKKESLHPILKEHFRCKGSSLNPPKIIRENEKEKGRHTDCGGSDKHSLPIRNGKEYIFPILIELINQIQEVTKKQVVITSGHRCPDHNSYIDSSAQNQGSKHLIGAACDFYVKGYENNPEAIVKIIQDFYKRQARYAKQSDYIEFKRFEKPTNCSLAPWYNKEIFVKVFKATEGRDDDNRHHHPYISLQVRFDRDRNVPLTFTWTDAQQFLRK
jgi:hypothetical protein